MMDCPFNFPKVSHDDVTPKNSAPNLPFETVQSPNKLFGFSEISFTASKGKFAEKTWGDLFQLFYKKERHLKRI